MKLQNSKYVMPWSTSHINLDRGHMGSTPDILEKM